MRQEEFSLGFTNVERLYSVPASLARRERIALYSLVYGLAPRFALEVGTFRGGSAAIISGAMEDVDTGGRLLCLEPYTDRVEPTMLELIGGRADLRRGFFPVDMPNSYGGRSTTGLFEFCFYDADHTYEGILDHLQVLPTFTAPGGYILCHDGYNVDQARGMAEAAKITGLIDCGMITRCANDVSDPTAVYGGMRLFKVPGELPPNS